jgi:uncharacterized repeat protein (TIGR02543 family)
MMMKKIYGTIAMLILALAMIALAACSNILDPPQPKQEAETGTVYIFIDEDSAGDSAAARTLAPPPANFTQYTASFEGPGTQADVTIAVGSTVSIGLVPGDWTITVTAYNGANTAAGEGSVTRTVVSNQTVTAAITITPLIVGTGDFRYSVAIPAVDSATLSLTNMTTNVTTASINLRSAAGSSGGTATATRNLAAGYYRMNILLEKSGTYAGRTEVVHIYRGLETTADYVFTDADFAAVVGTLTDGVWQDGEMTVSGSEYYKFSVTAGETYAVYWNGYYWNDYYGDGTKTLYCGVSTYYETGGDTIFSGVNSGYATPQVFTATSSGNVILRVEPYYSPNTGTYAVMYGEVKPLAAGTTETGTIAAGGVKLYGFPALPNMSYTVSWEDSGDRAWNSYYNGDIKVTAYGWSADSSSVLFNAVDSGYTTPLQVSSASATTIYLKVEGASAGTYSVKYELPAIPVLTDGVWHNAEMTVSGFEYYRFSVIEGETYAVYWNDGHQGDYTKGLDIRVSAYYETGGSSIFSNIDTGYTTPQVFTAASNGSVIIGVGPWSSGSIGTYAVLYGKVRPLAAGTAETGTITAGGVKLYSFPAAANTVYEVSWEDYWDQAGSSSYYGDITVTVYLGSIGSYALFYAENSGYTAPWPVWYTDSITINLKVDGVSDGTYSIKAQEPVQHTVTFNADGGSPGTQTRMVSGGGTVGSDMPDEPARSDYDFGGWHTGQNGGGTEFTDSTIVTESITVYARWNPSVPIQITLQLGPDDPPLTGKTVFVNQPATFNVEAGYSVYQWYWEGFVIGGATSSSYTLAASSKPTGIYELSVVVTDNAGERLSARCQVTIKAQ